ncbi:hypothetical protein BaRGS_00012151 [Batillaria attramentaria]|uniref:BZIP domain-containing protein n=1 Tax=Batillaria attramentaria TaxID=370345 RepID=A0ABD0LAM6_9CAEN
MATNPNFYGGMTLKALLENPDLQHPPSFNQGNNLKDKKSSSGHDVDFSSAFLGPQLWDKTYDIGDFNLEYMDLDEFLCENGIPVVEPQDLDQLPSSPPTSPAEQLCTSKNASPPQSPRGVPPQKVLTVTVPPVTSIAPKPACAPKVERVEELPKPQDLPRTQSPSAVSTGSTPPVSPVPVQVEFTLTEQDLALASIPGQNMFDPTRCQFTEEELKPQPMIKKSRKVFVPEEMKDDKYWARRKKNNYAAKRSRDARRVKENQIAIRAAYLERENGTLREEMDKLRKENVKLKHRLSKYEGGTST